MLKSRHVLLLPDRNDYSVRPPLRNLRCLSLLPPHLHVRTASAIATASTGDGERENAGPNLPSLLLRTRVMCRSRRCAVDGTGVSISGSVAGCSP